MSEQISHPETIWIITEDVSETSTPRGARASADTGGFLGRETTQEIAVHNQTKRQAVEVSKIKQEMRGFLQAMREMLDEAEPPSSKMQLDEVELSVEINGEGEIGLLGIAGAKAGGKGAMTFKFKRK